VSTTTRSAATPRLAAVLRGTEERVTPLELFFDLVFVLALTQCTALMAEEPTWTGLLKGLLILAVLWWSWVGYAWLTSVVDPEEGAVRLVMIGAMAALLVGALCVPTAFEGAAGLFAATYAAVRIFHILLFVLASRDDPMLRRSVLYLAAGTVVGTSLLLLAAFTDGPLQFAIWGVAIVLEPLGTYLFGVEGWKLVPHHFAERHALIVIIALGESIVAIGAGADLDVEAGVAVAAVVGMAATAALWWLYFDVVALVAARRLEHAAPGRERNSVARDSFSYLHYPMVAGIVLMALGFKKTLGDVSEPLKTVPAVALMGGTALYLLAHVAFRWRNVHRFSSQRLVAAFACIALVPAAIHVPALVTLALLAALLGVLVAYERARFAELRARLRHRLEAEPAEA
jgi:low temperature requirement protein LtrA